MEIRKAQLQEYDKVRRFYYQLIDNMASLPYHPKWQKGIYPEDAYIMQSICAGELHIAVDSGNIIGAMIVNNQANPGYSAVQWPTGAVEADTAKIHALGVAVAYMRSGIGRMLVREAIRLSESAGRKAIRLDVIDGNEPAKRLYTGQGFRFVQRVNMYYEDTGWCDFDLYEYPL